MNQLGLPISLNVQMSLANFVSNAQIKSAIDQLFNTGQASEIYVYGDAGSGKTHLLQSVIFSAIEQNKAAAFIDCEEEVPDYLVEMVADLDWLSIDNIDCVEEAQQHLLFDIYNRARQANVNIIVSGFFLPAELNIMKDLKTRLNLAAVFQLETLNDEQTKEALNNQMSERNISIDEKIYSYLFKHHSRDISTLLGVIDRLDEASMQAKQGISIPLIKKTLGL